MAIDENIRAREAAEAALTFIESEWSDMQPMQALRFWECLRDLCNAKLPQTDVEKEWTEQDAHKFEREFMHPGSKKWIGFKIIEVPPSYLEWWWENSQDNWTKRLGKYLKTKRFRDRQLAESSEYTPRE